MNVTNMINKIFKDYMNVDRVINNAIKYRFTYNGFQTDIFYTILDGLQNQLLFVITVNDIDYLSTLYFSENENSEFFMKPYLPPELYTAVKFTLLYINGKCSTTPYFDQMSQSIMNTIPFYSNYKADIKHRTLYQYNSQHDNPFFETIIRKNMSPQMLKKIKDQYDYNIARQILEYCGNTKTLRFTSDFSRSKDILTF